MAETENSSDEVSGQKREVNMCKPCGKKKIVKTADVYCKHCVEFQCLECSKVHDMGFSFMEGHELVSVANLHLEAPELKLDMMGIDVCSDHKKRFKLYCVDHDTLCCSMCVCTRHRSCKEVNELSTESQSSSDNAPDSLTMLSELEASVTESIALLQKTTTTTSSDIEAQLNEIDEMKQHVLEKFDSLKASLGIQTKNAYQKSKAELDERLSKTTCMKERIEGYKGMYTSVLENGSDEQRFIVNHVVKKQVNSYMADLRKEMNTISVPVLSFKNDALKQVLHSVDSFATPTLDLVHVESNIPVVLELAASTEVTQCVGDGRVPFYSGIDFLPDGRIVLVDNKNRRLRVMSEGLEKLGTFKFRTYCHDVAVICDERVAVTRNKFIDILHISKTNDITFLSSIDATVRCNAVCLLNDTTLLVSTYEDRRPLRMITLSGDETDLEGLYDKNNESDEIVGAYIRSKDMLIVTDRADDSVYFYDNKEKCSLRCIVKDDNIKEPTGVCVGPFDRLFVCSKGTHSVVQMSSSGKVLGAQKLEWMYPSTVAVSSDKTKLVVFGDFCGKELQLYHLR